MVLEETPLGGQPVVQLPGGDRGEERGEDEGLAYLLPRLGAPRQYTAASQTQVAGDPYYCPLISTPLEGRLRGGGGTLTQYQDMPGPGRAWVAPGPGDLCHVVVSKLEFVKDAVGALEEREDKKRRPYCQDEDMLPEQRDDPNKDTSLQHPWLYL